MPPWTRPLARINARAYSCTSHPVAPPTAPSSAAPPSKLRLAMNARKALGAAGVDGSGRLAMRRESMYASARGKSTIHGSSSNSSSSSKPVYTSAAAAYIANPTSSFRPVHLYPPQYALHASFTPSHMPLPVHLGIQTYLKPDSRSGDAGSLFERTREGYARERAVNNLRVVARGGTERYRRGMTGLREHLATIANLSTDPSLAALLPVGHTTTTTAATIEAETLSDMPSTAFGPSLEFGHGTTFDEMVRRRLEGTREGLSAMQQADQAWELVLRQMNDAARAIAGPHHRRREEPAATEQAISTAVKDVESLLARLGLRPRTSSFVRASSTRRPSRVALRAVRTSRVSAVGADIAFEETVGMDSVKRKRQKKISKHKYKKRRKATRAERKKLGK